MWREHCLEHVQNIMTVHTRAPLAVTINMSDEEDLLLAEAATVIICGYKHELRRHCWVRPSLKLGNEHWEMLYKEMVFDDEGLSSQHISGSGLLKKLLTCVCIRFWGSTN